MIGIIIGGLAVGFGVIMIALLQIAKQTDIIHDNPELLEVSE